MASKIVGILEAVKDGLNAAPRGTFVKQFAAERLWQPRKLLEDFTEQPRVMVVPKANDHTPLTRATSQNEIKVDVAIEAHLPDDVEPGTPEANALLDPYIEFAEQVADFFGPADANRGVYGDGKWVGTSHEPLYDHVALREFNNFLSLVTLTFKVL